MQELTLESWEEFVSALADLEICRKQFSADGSLGVSEYLYRGQSNSEWMLETTLERFTNKKLFLTNYYRFSYAAKSKVETFTEKAWEIPTPSEFENWVNEQDLISFINMPGYEYFAYLRHHGYPSPLLDWTASPYIAAFFAYRNAPALGENVSVYVYMEYAGEGKIGSADEPHILSFGPYATIHQRHFLQQSAYTVCSVKETKNFKLTSHELVNSHSKDRQDLIWKFNLPSTERMKVLLELNKMNINAYSLFLTVDSLMEATAILEGNFD